MSPSRRCSGARWRSKRPMRAYELLARVGLTDRADAYPDSMSGGEQRRAVIARALINSPSILLADEPTSDLDEDTENDIMALLEELQRSEVFAFVLVTHNLELAKHAARIYDMRQGALVSADLPEVTVPVQRPSRHFAPPHIASDVDAATLVEARRPAL